MLSLDVSAAPARHAVVAGESLMVTTVVRNTGSGPAEVPAMPALEFVVVNDDGLELPLSAAGLRVAIQRGEPVRQPPPRPRTLAPGAAAEFHDDLAQFALEKLVPGSYRVMVRLRVGSESFEALFSILVQPPQAKHVASAWEPAGRILAAQDEDGEDGPALLVRSGFSDLPRDGVGVRLLEKVKIKSLAVAVNVKSADSNAWVALIDDAGGLRALRWGPQVALGGAQAPPLDLGEPRLVPQGFRGAQGVLFAAVGESKGKGAVQLAIVGMKPGGGPAGPAFDKAMKLTPAVPFARAVPGQVLPIFDDAGAVLHLVWAEQEGPVSRIRRNEIKVAGTAGTDLLVLERGAPLLALGAPLEQRGAAPSINALFGPLAKDKPRVLIRARLDGTGTPSESELPALDEAVDAWGVSDDSAAYVLAHAGTRLLLFGTGPDHDWRKLADAGPGTSHLRIFQARPGEHWAEWFDPQTGLRHALIH